MTAPAQHPPAADRPGRRRRRRAVGALAAAAIGLGLAAPAAVAAPARTTRATISSTYAGTVDGQAVRQYRLATPSGMVVQIYSYGGIVHTIQWPGTHTDVVLGYPTLADYVKYESSPYAGNESGQGTYFGALIGRYANRIADGTFTLDGTTYHVPINNGPNSLHGGTIGFNQHVWTARVFRNADGSVSLRLTYVSPAGQMDFPGTLTTVATYTLSPSNRLTLSFRATTTADTVVNLTNHTYWNLAGQASGTVYAQRIKIDANRYTPVDSTQIPTGRIARVAGTPFDLRSFTAIGAKINEDNPQLLIGQGYDDNWVLDKPAGRPGALTQAAQVIDPATGRELTVSTTQPGLQFYSGNFLDGLQVGTTHRIYRQGDGFALETQHFPDSPNHANFPTTELKPGQVYRETTVWQLSQS